MKTCNQYIIKVIISLLTIVGLILFIPPIEKLVHWLWLHRDRLLGGVFFLLALGLFNLPLIKDKFNKWRKLPEFNWGDSFVLVLPVSIIYCLIVHYHFSYWLLMFLFLWFLTYYLLRKPIFFNQGKLEEKNHLYFELLGNVSPIESLEEDELERKEFAERIGELLKGAPTNANRALVCGIQGSWGSGKTSLMKMVFDWMGKQKTYSFEHIIFESWHYREPDRIVSVFFQTIEQVLSKYYPQIKSLLSEIANFVSSVSLGGVNFNLEKYFTERAKDSRKRLQEILENKFHRPLFIFVDDLDRLEKEELHAVLRSVRLLTELPNIHFMAL